MLRNNGDQGIAAEVVAYSASGQQAGSERVVLAAHSVVPVQVDNLIPASGSAQWGGLEVQAAGTTGQLAGRVILSEANGVSVSYALQGDYLYDTEQALWTPWWLPDGGTNGTITLFNTSAQSIAVTPSIAVSGVENAGKPVVVAAHAGATLDLRSLLAESDNGSARAGSVTLRYAGPANALQPGLLLGNPGTGFALMPDFGARHEQQASQQTSWQLPYVSLAGEEAGGRTEMRTAYALLSNGTKAELTPQITAYAVSDGTVQRVVFSVPALAPKETRLVDLSALAQQLPAGISRMALTISHSGQPGDLGITVFSMGSSGQVAVRSEGLVMGVPPADISYWDISSRESLLHLIQSVNGGNATAQATLYYQGTGGLLRSYQIPATLTANNTAKPINLTSLLRTGMPDNSGSRLSPAVTSGLVVLQPMGAQSISTAPASATSVSPTAPRGQTKPAAAAQPASLSSSPVAFVTGGIKPECISASSITGISPAQGLVGTEIDVTITGTGFAAGATVSAGSNISVSNVSVASSTEITATFTPSNSTSAGGNQTVTVSGATGSQTFFVQYPAHLIYSNDAGLTPNNGHSVITAGTKINIVQFNGEPNGQTIATGVCGGYQWLTYAPTDQSGNQITNGTITFPEAFSNFSPSPATDPFGFPTPSAPATVGLPGNFLADTQAIWNKTPPTCEPASRSDSFNQGFTAIVGKVTYPITTVVTVARSTNSQGVPSFNVSITTP